MRVIFGYPPNYKDIRAILRPPINTLFCYGDTIYNPARLDIAPFQHVHEAVHAARQMEMGPDPWWHQYLLDPKFRVAEETPAHKAEYEACVAHFDSEARRAKCLDEIAARLSGPLYGRVMTYDKAVKLIKGEE